MSKGANRRIRLFAGPNGSGKTTIIKAVRGKNKISLYSYINADDIELQLKSTGRLLLKTFNVAILKDFSFFDFADQHGLTTEGKISDLRGILKVNKLSIIARDKKKINSYVAALLADYFRETLLKDMKSFSFETVMSDRRKLDLIKRAKQDGYRIYLYFVATVTPEINISRVSQRVQLGGHRVDPELIKKRYRRSLAILFDAVKLTDRAYLFDNSRKEYELVAEITEGSKLEINSELEEIPNWFYKYFYLKALKTKRKK